VSRLVGRHSPLLAALALLFHPAVLGAQVLTELPSAGLQSDAAVTPPLPSPAPQPAAALAIAPGDDIAAEVGTRIAIRVQNPNSHDKLNDVGSNAEADVVLSGQVHPLLRWQAGFIGSYGDPAATTTTSAAILDLVAKAEFTDAFNLWLGRMPIPSDRASLSTVWAIAPWTLPGRYEDYAPTAPAVARPAAGPRQGDNDRGDGVTLWGQLGGGRFKYYLGAFGLDAPTTSPLYSARINLSLLNPEPGFRSASTYYGAKDVLAFGAGVQHQTSGSLPAAGSTATPVDFNELNADLLFEKNGGTAGVLDLEGEIAKLWGHNEAASYQFFALASYLVPIDIGIGRFQPLLRVQHAGKGSAADADDSTRIDAELGYLIDGHHARLVSVYQYTKVHGQTENAIVFGLQLLSHTK
jgi:hypothetical protein